MTDLLLLYRACGAECRDDYLRHVAHENGLPLACVRRIADQLGEREDFGALILICETRQFRRAAKGRTREPMGRSLHRSIARVKRPTLCCTNLRYCHARNLQTIQYGTIAAIDHAKQQCASND